MAVGLIRYHFHSIGELRDTVLAQAVASLALAAEPPIVMPEGDAQNAAVLSLTLDLVVLLSQDRDVTLMWLESFCAAVRPYVSRARPKRVGCIGSARSKRP